jgi:predicted secreted protein
MNRTVSRNAVRRAIVATVFLAMAGGFAATADSRPAENQVQVSASMTYSAGEDDHGWQ